MSIPTLYLDLTMTRHEETRSYPKPKVPDRYILQTLVITIPLTDPTLEKLHSHFPNIHYFPDGDLSKDKKVLGEGEVWFTGTGPFPSVVEKIEDVPKAKLLQLVSGRSFYSAQLLSV
jgi:hypothetical protein